MDKNARFQGLTGTEYELIKLSVPHYDQLEEAIANEVHNKFKNSEVDKIELLEIGSGTGVTTKFLLDVDSRVIVTAVDNEPIMMKQLSENIKLWNAENRVILQLNDILDYLKNIKDNSFDIVASSFVLHNFKRDFRNKVITEIYRVLKPAGLFVNGDKYAVDNEEDHKKNYKDQLERFKIYDSIGRPDYKEEWIKHYTEDERPETIFIEGEAKKYMEVLGFRDIKTVYREQLEAVIIGVK